METQRQKKIAGLLQQDLADILQHGRQLVVAELPSQNTRSVSDSPVGLFQAGRMVSVYISVILRSPLVGSKLVPPRVGVPASRPVPKLSALWRPLRWRPRSTGPKKSPSG